MMDDDDFHDVSRSLEEFQAAFCDLIRAGLIVPNGQYRRARDGTMQPAYVVADPDLTPEQVQERLEEFHANPTEGALR